MKSLAVLYLIATVVVARPESGYYDEKYDNFDVDTLIENQRLLKGYAHCFLSKGKCTPEGHNFKKLIPEALETDCSKCSDKQKVLIAKVVKALMERQPTEWDELNQQYNPTGDRINNIEEFVKKYHP